MPAGIQAAGAGVSTSSNDNEPESPAGKPLLLVGLAGQLIFFGIFAIFVIFMHSRCVLVARIFIVQCWGEVHSIAYVLLLPYLTLVLFLLGARHPPALALPN